jgi:hypothetical protein
MLPGKHTADRGDVGGDVGGEVGGGIGPGIVVHAAMHPLSRRARRLWRMGFSEAESTIKRPRS